nr:alpha/beta fold hydrolase [uncultured Allomuricauda sp.]
MYRLARIAIIVFALFLMLVAMLSLLQEKFIFLPTQLPKDYVYSFEKDFEELFLEAQDGAELNALYFKVKNAKGLILYFHGNAGDLSRWGTIADRFVDFGYEVLVMDYRGYGKSTGKMSEENLYADAQLFFNHAAGLHPQEKIIVYGRSLGASIATHLASRNKTKKLILETPFYNLADVAQDRFPFLPVKSLLRYKMASNEFVKKVEAPIRIFHGTADRVVAYESGKKLYGNITVSDKKMYTIENGAHNNLDQFKAYWNGIELELR